MLPRSVRPVPAFTIGAVIFASVALAVHAVLNALGWPGPATRQVLLKSALLLVSLTLMALLRRPRATWGWVMPRRIPTSTLLPAAVGGVLGAASSTVIVGAGLPSMPGIREMGLVQIIAVVWFGSTLAEEVFVRGLIQGWMQPLDGPSTGTTARTLASGLLFGAMHLSLFVLGADPRTAVVIVVATTMLGLACAWSRECSGSLVGPLLAHLAFNVGGVIGGVVTVVARGRLPAP